MDDWAILGEDDLTTFALPDVAHGGEWPLRDAVPCVRLPKVVEEATEAMVAAARGAIGRWMSRNELTAIYRAMHAVAPVELVSEGERNASRQIELLQARNRVLEAREIECVRERDVARESADYWYDRLMRRAREDAELDAEIVALRIELMAARDTIAKLTPPVPNSPGPAPNPFRAFPGDHRRIGG